MDLNLVLTRTRNQAQQTVIVKSVQDHFRVQNERDVLRHLNGRSSHIRPLLDEIQDPAEPVTIVLPYLQDDLLEASKKKSLTSEEIRYVSRRVLKALSIIHHEGYVHTGQLIPTALFLVSVTKSGARC